MRVDRQRIRKIVQWAGARWIDPIFTRRHPGAATRGMIRLAAPFVRVLQPNDQ